MATARSAARVRSTEGAAPQRDNKHSEGRRARKASLTALDGTAARQQGTTSTRSPLRRSATFVRVLGLAIVGGSLFVAALITILILQVVMLQRQQELDALNAKRVEMSETYQSLRRQVAEAEDPATVLRRARNDLGMVPAPDIIYLVPETVPQREPIQRTLPTIVAAPAEEPAETVTPSSAVPADEEGTSESSGEAGAQTSDASDGDAVAGTDAVNTDG